MLKNRTVNIVFLFLTLGVIFRDVFGHVSVWIYIVLLGVYIISQAYGAIILSAQFFLPVKFHGNRSANQIAITFDDGPIPGKTERILDILKVNKIPAAFFCIGSKIKDNLSLLQRIHEEGHVIGNHSYWHGRTFDLQSSMKIFDELKNTDEVILKSIGVKPNFFRPPYGVTNRMVASAVTQGNYITVGWSLRSFDTITKDGSKLFNRVIRSLKAGDVILFHDYCESTLEILPALLDHISKTGLKIVRVDELLNEKAYV